MSFNCYNIGSSVSVFTTFTTAAGVPANPDSVVLRIMNPNGIEQIVAQASLTNTSPGVFSYQIEPLIPGVWYYRWEGEGPIDVAQDNAFVVTSSVFVDAA